VKWLNLSAHSGDPLGEDWLGGCYRDGTGVKKDYAKALNLFQKSANQNDPQGEFDLGLCYYVASGTTKDYGEAVKWFQKSANQNNFCKRRSNSVTVGGPKV